MFKVEPWVGNPDYWSRMDDWLFPNRTNPSSYFNHEPGYRIKHLHYVDNNDPYQYPMAIPTLSGKCERCKTEIPALVKAAFLVEVMEHGSY